MRPAIGKLYARTDPVRCNQAVVSGIAVDLQNAAKALQDALGMLAGRMGGNRRTVQNLRIQAVDTEKGLLLISGAIPGPKNGVVLVRSAVKGA